MTFGPLILRLTDEGVVEIELPHLGCSLLLKPIAKCPTLPPATPAIDTTGVPVAAPVVSLADYRRAS